MAAIKPLFHNKPTIQKGGFFMPKINSPPRLKTEEV